MNCRKCGAQFNDDAIFCPVCGEKVEFIQSNNSNLNGNNMNSGGSPNNDGNKKLLIVIITLLAVLIVIFAFIAGTMINKDKTPETTAIQTTYSQPETTIFTTESETYETTTKKTTKHKTTKKHTTKHVNSGDAFYGIWCSAYKSRDKAENDAQKMRNKGFYNAEVFVSSEWSNMNQEKWYCVTADKCYSKSDANRVLKDVKKVYRDAYVKYTGSYKGSYYEEETTVKPGYESTYPGFYGIWCSAYKSESKAQADAEKLRSYGFYNADVYLTTDWKNLNSEPWYCVSADQCNSKSEANQVLKKVKKYYKSAYVKHSGAYRY